MTRARNQGPSGPLPVLPASATLPHPGGFACCFAALPLVQLVPCLRGWSWSLHAAPEWRRRVDAPAGHWSSAIRIPQEWARLMGETRGSTVPGPCPAGQSWPGWVPGHRDAAGTRPPSMVDRFFFHGRWRRRLVGPDSPQTHRRGRRPGRLLVWVATGASSEAIGNARSSLQDRTRVPQTPRSRDSPLRRAIIWPTPSLSPECPASVSAFGPQGSVATAACMAKQGVGGKSSVGTATEKSVGTQGLGH